MPYKEALLSLLEAIVLAAGSAGSAILAFMAHSLPVVQWIGCVVAIGAGCASIRASCATHNAIKKGK